MSLILITGGSRAGKSLFAENLARQLGGDAVCYIATTEPGDADLAARIATRQAARPAGWLTVEAPRRIADRFVEAGRRHVVIVDCLTTLVSNVLLAHPESVGHAQVWPEIEAEVVGVTHFAESTTTTVIVVTNEVGLEIVPPTPLNRIYGDLLGRANQQLGAAADAVYLLVSGIPIEIKALAASQAGWTP